MINLKQVFLTFFFTWLALYECDIQVLLSKKSVSYTESRKQKKIYCFNKKIDQKNKVLYKGDKNTEI